jgi:hypothetical protein
LSWDLPKKSRNKKKLAVNKGLGERPCCFDWSRIAGSKKMIASPLFAGEINPAQKIVRQFR